MAELHGLESAGRPTKIVSLTNSIPTPTLFHQNILQPRITPGPSSSCPPDILVVHLSTTVIIPDFNAYYAPASIETFVPIYSTYPDGSLISSSFQQDLTESYVGLLVMGALAMVFTRNIIVSGDYIRRGKVKKKMLFYALFLSQILAPVSLTPVILSYFDPKTPCNLVVVMSCICGATSLALLITVILGVKVYKCLNNARFIPVVLALFQMGSVAVVVLDIIKTRVVKRLSGTCFRTDDLRFTRYFVVLQFAESLFICSCFLFVCWKSRKSPTARGRISIELSMDDLPIEFPADPVDKPAQVRRGWWDYVPEPQEVPPIVDTKENPAEAVNEKNSGTVKGFFRRVKSPASTQKSKVVANGPRNKTQQAPVPAIRNSLAPSSMSRLSRLIPRMELFRQVMKDELLYTTFITFNCVIVAVLVIIGVNVKNGLSVAGWIALNWCIISLLAIHSFGRVVHRHERDALLSHPATCTAINRAANEIVEREQRSGRRQAPSLPPTTKSFRIARDSANTENDDPFADTQPLAPNRASNPMPDDRDTSSILSIPRSYLVPDAPSVDISSSQVVINKFRSSLDEQDFPSSSPATPTVSIKYFEKAHQREFSRSWLVSSNSQSTYSESYRSDPRFSKEAAT